MNKLEARRRRGPLNLVEILLATQERLVGERESVSLTIEEAKGHLRTIDAKLKRIPDLITTLEALDLEGILDDVDTARPSRRHGKSYHSGKGHRARSSDTRSRETFTEEAPEAESPEAVSPRKRTPKKDAVQAEEEALVVDLADRVREMSQDDAVKCIAERFDGVLDTNLASRVFLEAGLMRRVGKPSLTKCKRAVASVVSREVRDGSMVRVDNTTVFVSPHKPKEPPKAKRTRGAQRSKPFHTSIEGR